MTFQLCALNFELVQRTLALSFQLGAPRHSIPASTFELSAMSYQLCLPR
jgi:hypothetical protein